MDQERDFIAKYTKGVVFRHAGPCDDLWELQRDLMQDAYAALAKCPSNYVWPQKKVAIRYSVMQALTRWRWQVTYHGKKYVRRDDMYQTDDGDCDKTYNMDLNPELWAIAREEASLRASRITRTPLSRSSQTDKVRNDAPGEEL